MKYLKIKTLNKGYQEPYDLLLHAMFQILVDFVEDESINTIDWNYNTHFKTIYKEIMFLYNWWTKKYPSRTSPIDNIKESEAPSISNGKLTKGSIKWRKACKQHHKLEEKWLKEDQDNLHRLIKIRLHLWT